MSLYQPKGSPFWHYDFQWKGGRFHGSTRETSKRRAQAVEDHEKLKAKTGTNQREATLDDVADSYWEAKGKHARAAKADEQRLLWLVTALGPQRLIHEFEEPDLLAVVKRRQAEGSRRGRREKFQPVSNATVNRVVTELFRRLHRHAEKSMKLRVAPIDWAVVKLPEAEARARCLTADEEARLMDALRPDIRPLVRFSMVTGLRQEDARTLTRFNVDLQAGRIRVKVKSSKPGRKTHTIKLGPSMVALLANELGCHTLPQVFTCIPHDTHNRAIEGAARKPITLSILRRQFERAIATAGIEDFRWHDLRHTAGTRTSRAAGLRVAQMLLGHESITTTARYDHPSEDDIAAAMEAAASAGATPAQSRSADQSRNTPEAEHASGNNALKG